MPNPTTDTYLRCLRQGNGLGKKKDLLIHAFFVYGCNTILIL